jgi:hypothetical protein
MVDALANPYPIVLLGRRCLVWVKQKSTRRAIFSNNAKVKTREEVKKSSKVQFPRILPNKRGLVEFQLFVSQASPTIFSLFMKSKLLTVTIKTLITKTALFEFITQDHTCQLIVLRGWTKVVLL